ncbi:MAG TPA: HAD family hydrolase [Candidatus Limnocylindrales bacterium]|nr:HAD family hydrolase [Candidatus Limnocylindrales bacterium]
MTGGPGARDDRRTVFLDKDGTLIDDLPYNVDPRRVRFAPGAREAVRLLGGAGYRLVIATNQAGIARGYFTEAELREVERHLASEIAALGGTLEAFLFCPHLPAPDGVNEFAIECACRKPEPGMIRRAVDELGVDPARAWFVGDTWMDVLAGRRGGCRTIMVGPEASDAGSLPEDRRPEFAVADLLDAARIILAEDGTAATTATVAGAAHDPEVGAPAPVRVEATR